MNPLTFVVRRPITALMLAAGLGGGLVFGMYEMRVDLPPLHTSGLYARIDQMVERVKEARSEGHEGSKAHEEGEGHGERHKIVVTRPKVEDVTLTQPYVCQIHSQRHINVCALEGGYLQEICVKEGQAVKKGDPLFKIVPTLYQARLDAENAEARLAQLELKNTKRLFETKIGGGSVVSENEVFLLEAKLAKAQAKAQLAKAELNFANVKAPFDGIVDRLHEQLGSLIKEGDILTTLSDNSVMWVYFNVPEKDYLEYMANLDDHQQDGQIELILAGDRKFSHLGKIDPAHNIGAIEANFNNETGNIAFRADFPNPERLLRHGQTGTVRIRRVAKGALVIPQRATFEVLDKRYVYAVDKDDVVHQREIVVDNELDDLYIVGKGLDANDKIVLEGTREVRDGEKIAYEFRGPEAVIAHLKNRAE